MKIFKNLATDLKYHFRCICAFILTMSERNPQFEISCIFTPVKNTFSPLFDYYGFLACRPRLFRFRHPPCLLDVEASLISLLLVLSLVTTAMLVA